MQPIAEIASIPLDYYVPPVDVHRHKPGDVLNRAGSHVVLFTEYHLDGTIDLCEASGSKARVIHRRTTWSRFKSYIPMQYKAIDELE